MSANHRLLRCTRYLLASIYKPCLVFLGIYLLVAFGLPLLLQLTASGGITHTIFGPDNLFIRVVSPISSAFPLSARLRACRPNA